MIITDRQPLRMNMVVGTAHIQSRSMNQNEEALYANKATETCESDTQMQDSLFMDAIFAMKHGLDNDAMDAILEYIADFPRVDHLRYLDTQAQQDIYS